MDFSSFAIKKQPWSSLKHTLKPCSWLQYNDNDVLHLFNPKSINDNAKIMLRLRWKSMRFFSRTAQFEVILEHFFPLSIYFYFSFRFQWVIFHENKHNLYFQRIGVLLHQCFFITEILWRTFWHNNWRSIFDVEKNSAALKKRRQE